MYINKIRFLSAVLLVISLSFTCNYAQAWWGTTSTTPKDKPVEIDGPPDTSEMLEELSRFTGLTSDALSAIMEESPALITNLSDTVTAVKVVDHIYNAKDSEAVGAVANWYLSGLADKSVAAAFGAGAASAFAAAKAYKATLDIIHDYAFVPAFEEKIYKRYKNLREASLGRKDVHKDAMELDYELATKEGVFDKGYFAVKGEMVNAFILKKYGKTKEQQEELSEMLKNHARKQVDDYWMNRMEAKFQQEQLKENKDKYIQEIWEKQAKELEAIRAAAAKLPGEPERFFFTAKDIPQGWKLSRDKDSSLTVKKQPNTNFNYQSFKLYPAEYVEKVDKQGYASYYTPKGDHAGNVTVIVSLMIGPRFDTLSGHHFDWVDDVKERPKHMSNLTIKEFKDEGVITGFYAIFPGKTLSCFFTFVKGPSWFVERLDVSANHSAPVSEEFALKLARTIARKFPAGEPGQKEAKKK
ncbi:MAG TPA: hypothetical protein ACFYD2_05405 [Candidatus Avalokitesvara rifleensis]|uniref:hypothetical protein n=1 Tax=Candidatus Avalokitesvara rifleensis TaxID=3367620 RepID=UPI004028DB8A